MPKGCKKCGAKVENIYSTFNAVPSVAGEPTALVHVSESAYLESIDGTRRLYLGEEIKLQFSLIAQLLNESCDIIYFKDNIEKMTFIAAYPELESCAR